MSPAIQGALALAENRYVELIVCVDPGCGLTFAESDGFAGNCPSCLAIRDEHDAGLHRRPVADCRLCG